jgi:hypothetical protein
MDLRTGQTYETEQQAIDAGVPRSDIAHVEQRLRDGKPIVKFSKGSFKSYRREDGELVRVS